MPDNYSIEEENVHLRQALERTAFLAVGSDCKNASCMHSACAAVRVIQHNLTAFMKKKRPDEVVGYQERITELTSRLRTIREVSSEP